MRPTNASWLPEATGLFHCYALVFLWTSHYLETNKQTYNDTMHIMSLFLFHPLFLDCLCLTTSAQYLCCSCINIVVSLYNHGRIVISGDATISHKSVSNGLLFGRDRFKEFFKHHIIRGISILFTLCLLYLYLSYTVFTIYYVMCFYTWCTIVGEFTNKNINTIINIKKPHIPTTTSLTLHGLAAHSHSGHPSRPVTNPYTQSLVHSISKQGGCSRHLQMVQPISSFWWPCGQYLAQRMSVHSGFWKGAGGMAHRQRSQPLLS